MQEPDIMTLQEVADHFGIKPESVRKLMRRHGVAHLSGYSRTAVRSIERKQGRRTDLEKD